MPEASPCLTQARAPNSERRGCRARGGSPTLPGSPAPPCTRILSCLARRRHHPVACHKTRHRACGAPAPSCQNAPPPAPSWLPASWPSCPPQPARPGTPVDGHAPNHRAAGRRLTSRYYACRAARVTSAIASLPPGPAGDHATGLRRGAAAFDRKGRTPPPRPPTRMLALRRVPHALSTASALSLRQHSTLCSRCLVGPT